MDMKEKVEGSLAFLAVFAGLSEWQKQEIMLISDYNLYGSPIYGIIKKYIQFVLCDASGLWPCK